MVQLSGFSVVLPQVWNTHSFFTKEVSYEFHHQKIGYKKGNLRGLPWWSLWGWPLLALSDHFPAEDLRYALWFQDWSPWRVDAFWQLLLLTVAPTWLVSEKKDEYITKMPRIPSKDNENSICHTSSSIHGKTSLTSEMSQKFLCYWLERNLENSCEGNRKRDQTCAEVAKETSCQVAKI